MSRFPLTNSQGGYASLGGFSEVKIKYKKPFKYSLATFNKHLAV